MSTWTHVVGTIRYDHLMAALARPGFESMAEEIYPLPLPTKVPMGSEGPLTIEVSRGGNGHEGYGYFRTVTIFGDLRDFNESNCMELNDWFKEATNPPIQSGVIVRDAIFSYYTEGGVRKIFTAGGPDRE